MNANLLLAASFVLVLLSLLAYTVWYRAHKRRLRRCTCGCQPERIGQIWPILQPSGTHLSIDGEKVLALVLTRCHTTGTITLVKWEEKYVGWVGRQWKLLTEPKAYAPDLELLLCVADAPTVVDLMEKIRQSDGSDATSIFASITKIPPGTPENLSAVLKVVLRRRRSRSGKAATTELKPARYMPPLVVAH